MSDMAERLALHEFTENAYLNYSMYVIMDRALPFIGDGLKPVQRRIVYAMSELGLNASAKFKKSARTVGDVLGKYHPHGDSACYEAMVLMAQPFSYRYPLVDGQGNWGAPDDPKSFAAMRYTESRLSKYSELLLSELGQGTADWVPNFDGTLQEPKMLPARLPNILLNGTTGIAVGMATNMPPHNLTEVINGICHVIDNPEAGLDEICQYIKGPDFPTGGVIMGRSGIRAAYATGRGKLKVRARTHFEEMPNNRTRIVATEIPYGVNKARLVESIADLVKDKRVEGISDLRDESDREGIRVVIELKRDANAQVVLNQLFHYTQLQDTFSVNNLALVNNQPRTLNLRELIDQYIEFQREIIERRSRYELKRAEKRAHILEGLKVATENIDRIIAIIRASANETEAKQNLIAETFIINQIALLGIVDGKEEYPFHLDEEQAQAIVSMRLGRLSGLERQKLVDEYNEIEGRIHELMDVLGSRQKQLEVVRTELLAIRDKFGDERRTGIEIVDDDIDIEDLIPQEDCTYTLTHRGYIKRLPTSSYRAQRRGGRGVNAMATREEDYAEVLFAASSHDNILFFSSFGKVYLLKGYQIPETSRTAKGTNLVNLLTLENGETISAMFSVPEEQYDEKHYLFFTTERGIVKRVCLADMTHIRKTGLRALSLNEGDRLIDVRLTDDTQDMLLITAKGRGIRFHESEVRAMGRSAVGVKGIELEEDDRVIGGVRARPEGEVLTITENGFGKRTPVEDYSIHHRGGKGILAHALSDATGHIAGCAVVDDDNDVLIITDDGVMIRTDVGDIRLCGRNSKGVIVMRTGDNVHVNAITRVDKEPEEEPAEDEVTESAETQDVTTEETDGTE